MGIGGSERVCVNLTNEWTRLGHEVHIVTLNLDNDIYTDQLDRRIQVHTLGVSRLRYAVLPMLKFIRRHNPAFFFIFGNEMAVIINKLHEFGLVNTPIVVRVLNNVNISLAREDNVSPVVEKYLQKSQGQMRHMNHIVAQCDAMGRQLVDKGVVKETQLSIIYNPVSNELLSKVKELRTNERKIRNILFVGRIDPQKNPQDLIEVFDKVHGRLSDTVLHIAGDGSLKNRITELINSKNLTDSVVFHGIRNDMEQIYAIADVVVLTSDYEGMPNCLIEAIGCGIPVVSYDCPIGPAEIVEDGINGFLVPLGDVNSMAEKIIDTLSKSWDYDVIKNTCKKFKVDNIALKYLDIFERIIDESKQ